MQKGMLSPWLMRFHLSAAIALPSLILCGLVAPVSASETIHLSSTVSHRQLDKDTVKQGTANPATANISLAPTAFAPQFADGSATPPATASHEHQSLENFLQASEPTVVNAEVTARPAPESTLAPALAQADTASPESEVVDDADGTAPLTDTAPEDDVFVPLPDSEESELDSELDIDNVEESDEAPLEDIAEPEQEEATDLIEEADEFLDNELDPAVVEPDAAIDTIDEGGVPIPESRVVDDLEYLDPLPNPLLIQTQPEEVEIIGTQPLSLEETLELAYRNNPDLRVVLLELEQSQAALREAQADNYPTISINGNIQGQNTTDASSSLVPTPGGGFAFETETNEELGIAASAQAEVTYNVYSSGLRESSIRAAEEQVELAELEVERRRAEVRLTTANEYYDLQAAIEAIRISQAFLTEAERNLRDTSLREEVGVGTRFDVLRAEVQVANARQDLVNSERARQVAQRTLARRLNVPPSIAITTVPVDIAGSWPLDLEESIVLAYQNRAELEQQLTQREINEELRQAELAALGPQVDLFANYTISDTLTQGDSFSDNYSFGARASWTLFDGGQARARARQRELDTEIAERNFEETRNTIRLSVESAYFNLQSNLTNIETARLAVEQAQEALDLAILRFDAGVGTQLDILNAQSELTDAEVNLVQAVIGYNRSLAELERAVSNLPESYYQDLPY